jgi:uncharacterized membrane protein
MAAESDLIVLISALSALAFPFMCVLASVLALRAWRRAVPRDGMSRARSILNKRLATGDIGVEEYYEREAALRDAQPLRLRR